MIAISIFFAALTSTLIIFLAIYAANEKNSSEIEDETIFGFRKDWISYVVSFAAIVAILIFSRIWIEGVVYVQFSDFLVFWCAWILNSLVARKYKK